MDESPKYPPIKKHPKRSILQWALVILLFLFLSLVQAILNQILGFKHAGGAFLASLTAMAISGLCAVLFYAPIFKSNINRRKGFITLCWVAIIPVAISGYLYVNLFQEKFSPREEVIKKTDRIVQELNNRETELPSREEKSFESAVDGVDDILKKLRRKK